MATTQTLHDGVKTAVMKFHFDDGAGEAAVLKVDVSALAAEPRTAKVCNEVAIEMIFYIVSDGLTVDVLWDADTDVVATSLAYNGCDDYRAIGPIKNNSSTGKTGDIKFTTVGTVGADSRYTVILVMRKSYAT